MKMFGFSRRRMKLGRLKVQLSDSTQGTNSPIRHVKRSSKSDGEAGVRTSSNTDELNCQCSSTGVELNNSTSGSSDSWTVFSASGDKPSPRFNHAATVIGDKMVVVGGESGQGLLEDVQVLNFEKFTWTTATSKLYLSPASLPLKIPACKGHTMVTWGKKALLIGGKTNPASDRISVWAFDTETESWSLIEAKGNVPVARSGHSVIRAGSVLILFGGEDTKGRKLNDLHMFDLKSLMWLPLHCTGTGPSPRTNHVAALYEDRILLIFGGASKSRTLNDLYSLDFETMIWTRIKIRGFHPSPRAGCRGVLCGSKWYIVGGGSKKKLDEVTKYIPDPPGMSISCNSLGHADTLVFDVLKLEWSVAIASSPTSITSSKGFSLVLVHHKEKVLVVAFGGWKKEASNQIEVLVMERNEQLMGRQTMPNKGSGPALYENSSSKSGFADQPGARPCSVDSVARQNIASVLELHGSGRRSISVSSLADPNPISNSFHKHLHNEEENKSAPSKNIFEDEHYKEADHCSVSKSASLQAMEQRIKASDTGIHTNNPGVVLNKEELSSVFDPRAHQKQVNAELLSDKNDIVVLEANEKKVGLYQLYETKIAALTRKNGMLEEQLTTAMTNKETAENDLSSVIKSKQEIEKKLTDTVKEMELLKEKLSSIEVAQEEANSLSNIVHSDNVRLEHDVAFLKAVLDDTQKELHSTRGVLAGERARAFQLQVEVFHLKQRLQSMENRAPTPRKPFHL